MAAQVVFCIKKWLTHKCVSTEYLMKKITVIRFVIIILVVVSVFLFFYFATTHNLSILRILGRDPKFQIERGNTLINEGNYEEAAIIFNNLIAEGVFPAQSLKSRGDIFLALGRFDEAIRDYSASLNFENTAQALASRCNTYRLYTKYDEALQDCQDALALESDNKDALLVTILLHIDQGNYDEAKELIDYLILKYPTNSVGYFSLAQLQIAQGPSMDAIKSLSEAIELDPNILQYYWERGFLYYSNGMIEKSQADMMKIIELADPQTDGELLYRAGTLMNSFSGYINEKPNP